MCCFGIGYLWFNFMCLFVGWGLFWCLFFVFLCHAIVSIVQVTFQPSVLFTWRSGGQGQEKHQVYVQGGLLIGGGGYIPDTAYMCIFPRPGLPLGKFDIPLNEIQLIHK